MPLKPPTEDEAFDRWFTLEPPANRRRPLPQRPFDPNALQKQAVKVAVTELAKAIGGSGVPNGQLQGGWNNLGNAAMGMLQRVTGSMAQQFNVPVAEIEQELIEQGLGWGAPFPPGRPLDPFFGYRRPPRTWDFQVGENVQLTPRWNRVSFKTLKSIYEAYDVAQIAGRHLINDVRTLEYTWEPLPGIRDDLTDDIAMARAFFEYPDRRQPFRAWLAEYLQDVVRYDAGTLYVRRSEDGTPIALEVVSGETIIPLVDYYGRIAADENDEDVPETVWPGGETPSYLQIIEGMPWDWLTNDDLIYQAWNPLPESQYGQAPLEAVLLTANTDIRFQWHFMEYFTKGSIPAGFMEAPPDMSDPTQLAEWQETWDALMLGDQAKLRQVRWVPAGAKFTPVKSGDFDANFPLYLMRRTAAAFGVTPNDLGFTEDVNRAVGETQVDVQFRVGTMPLVRHVEGVINLFVAKELGLRVRLKFDKGQETEDRVATAQADKIYIEAGVISPDEPRTRLGYPVDRERPVPRFIQNQRSGPIPLIALESLAGKIDEETYAPDQSQPLVPNPFMPVPGTLPQQGTPELKAVAQASAQMGRNMLQDTTGQGPGPEMQQLVDAATPPPPGQDQAQPDKAAPDNSNIPLSAEPARKAYVTVLDAIFANADGGYGDMWVNDKKKKVLISFGDWEGDLVQPARAAAAVEYPGYKIDADAEVGAPDGANWRQVYVHGRRVESTAKGALDLLDDLHAQIAKLTEGITTATGIGGVDLLDEDEDDEPDEAQKQLELALDLRRWRENSRNRLRKGLRPRRFHDTSLPSDVVDSVWARLQDASTRREVDAVFADAVSGPFRYKPRSSIRRP